MHVHRHIHVPLIILKDSLINSVEYKWHNKSTNSCLHHRSIGILRPSAVSTGHSHYVIWKEYTISLNGAIVPWKIKMSLKTSTAIMFDGNSQETQTGQGLPARLGEAGDHHVWSLGLCSWIHHLNLWGTRHLQSSPVSSTITEQKKTTHHNTMKTPTCYCRQLMRKMHF